HDRLFTALNTAFLQDAAVVIVPPDTSIAAPLHLLFIATDPGAASHPRILVIAGCGSSVTVVEDHVALHDGSYFSNPVAEIAVDAAATVEHVRIQRDSDAAFHI